MGFFILLHEPTGVCGALLTQQKDFNLPPFLLLLLLQDPLDLFVHSNGVLLLLGQTAHAGAVAPPPAAGHGQKH